MGLVVLHQLLLNHHRKRKQGKKMTHFWLAWCYHADTEALWGLWVFRRIWLTKRLSNFFASVMWIQLSFSITLMCFTSSLNLKKKRESFWNRNAQKGVLRCIVSHFIPLKNSLDASTPGFPHLLSTSINPKYSWSLTDWLHPCSLFEPVLKTKRHTKECLSQDIKIWQLQSECLSLSAYKTDFKEAITMQWLTTA